MLKLFKVSIIYCLALIIFSFSFSTVLAKTETYTVQGEDIGKNKPVITVEIGGFSGWNDTAGWSKGTEYCPAGTKAGVECLQISWISDYIVVIYKYGVGLAAVLAVVVIMVGGFIWLMSGGSSTRVSTAKDFIFSALAGLLLALFSFVILYTVNPRLVSLGPITSTLGPVTTETAETGIVSHWDTAISDDNIESIWQRGNMTIPKIKNIREWFNTFQSRAGHDVLIDLNSIKWDEAKNGYTFRMQEAISDVSQTAFATLGTRINSDIGEIAYSFQDHWVLGSTMLAIWNSDGYWDVFYQPGK